MSHNTKYFFIAGNPVFHSLSPVLFNAHASGSGFAGQYIKALCSSAKDIEVLLGNGFSGGNITAPFKEKILKLAFNKSPVVQRINAANLIVEKNGKLTLENTDIDGVKNALRTVISDFAGRKAVVAGAGGAGRAAALALIESGCDVTMINRTVEKAKSWADKLGCRYASIENAEELIRQAGIIVNTISSVDNIIPHVQSHHIVLDADYKISPLKYICREKGATYISGHLWLVYQAIPAFEQLTGFKVNEDILLKAVETGISEVRKSNIILTGMMKSGKTTIGKILALKSGRQFVDTDALIEARTGKTISEIFAESGEEYFRKIEKEIFSSCVKSDNQVIATGGGLVLDEENRTCIHGNGIGVWLFTSATELASRNDSVSRPLLDAKNKEKHLTELLGRRFSDYIQSTELLIPTDGKTPDEIAELIAGSLS
jgi:shikimate dehydrogenase